MKHCNRRQALNAGIPVVIARPLHAAGTATLRALEAGGVVVAMRHAKAPGTYDPPGFTLGQCATQRNLNDEGRAQARAIGTWFQARALKPARVRSSPWCRCMDTATLAFGNATEAWDSLASPSGESDALRQRRLDELRLALLQAGRQPGRFEVWVTHMFVLADLTGERADSGDGLVLEPAANGGVRVLGRLVLT